MLQLAEFCDRQTVGGYKMAFPLSLFFIFGFFLSLLFLKFFLGGGGARDMEPIEE